MKTLSRLLMLAALATVFALPAFAQDPAASPAGPCDEAAKNDLYTQYYDLKKTNQAADQAKAYDIAKQYIAKYDSCTDQYTKALKSWVGKYEAATGALNRRSDFFKAFIAKDIAKTNGLAQQLLATDPNDAAVAMLAGWGTYQGTIAKNPAATDADALNFANKAVELINSGKEPTDLAGKVSWAPFASKEEALSYLNLEIAALELKTNPDDASKRLVSIAQSSTKVKEEPSVYSYLAFTYEKEIAPMLEKYKTFSVENDESRLLLANINQVVDRTIDAYARAVAYSTDATQKAEFMKRLTELYKSRHDGAETGLPEMLAGIKAQPLLITQPITSLPAATPTASPTPPADGASAAPATGQTTPAGAPVAASANSTAKPTATTTTPPAKPQPTTTTNPPAKKKP